MSYKKYININYICILILLTSLYILILKNYYFKNDIYDVNDIINVITCNFETFPSYHLHRMTLPLISMYILLLLLQFSMVMYNLNVLNLKRMQLIRYHSKKTYFRKTLLYHLKFELLQTIFIILVYVIALSLNGEDILQINYNTFILAVITMFKLYMLVAICNELSRLLQLSFTKEISNGVIMIPILLFLSDLNNTSFGVITMSNTYQGTIIIIYCLLFIFCNVMHWYRLYYVKEF